MTVHLARAAALALLLVARLALAADAGADVGAPVGPDAGANGFASDVGREIPLPSPDAGSLANDAAASPAAPSGATSPSLPAPGPQAKASADSARRPRPALPPPVVLSLASTSPVLGIDAETELRIVVSGDFPLPLPLPRIVCSTGRIEDVVREGPASFSARFVLPATRFPQVAIIIADFSRDALNLRGTLVVRLRAATSPGFNTEPGAKVTVQVGDKGFGPVVAHRDGSIHVPVVVPPGINFALARSVNRYGKSSQQLIDLKIPHSRRMLVLAPEKLAAGTAGEVVVVAAEPNGKPLPASAMALTSSGPRPQPLGGRNPGEARFLVQAPAVLVDPTLHLVASLRNQPEINEEIDLVLVPAPTSQISLERETLAPEPHPPTSLRLFLSTKDPYGNPTDPGDASTLVDGKTVSTQAADDGRAILTVRPPSPMIGQDSIEVEAALENGYALDRVPMSLFQRKRPPDPFLAARVTVTPRLGLVWNTQQQPGASMLVEGLFSFRPGLKGLAVGLATGYLHSRFSAGHATGAGHVTLDQMPLLALARYRHRIQRIGLSGGVGLGAAFVQSRFGVFDRELAGQTVAFAWEVSGEASLLWFRSQAVVGLRYLGIHPGKLSSGDVILGDTGGLLLDVGYRYGWK
jgi:hypothetical protein